MNFLTQWLSPKGTVGGKAWRMAEAANYSPKQIKVAVQQLQRAGYGVNNAPGQFFHQGGPMRGVPGMGNPDTGYVNPGNPLGRFQGPGGNLGQKYYRQARDSGEFNLADIPDLARQSGMFLPSGAQAQWEMDMAAERAEEKFDEAAVNYSTAGSDVGSGASGVLTKKDKRAGKTGSVSDLKRGNMLINKQLNL
tara:strand:+ start:1247 stop:1825 length:579 start_codon:yes stop_codon:yes gene_type:complete